MKAAWYERQGPAADVLVVGEAPEPSPAPGEVRLRVVASGVNPGDVKKRNNAFGYGMGYPRVIPHSDGAGVIDRVGAGVDSAWIDRRVWCYGAQSGRPFGTAAKFVTVPLPQVAPLPPEVSFDTGACLGIPGITAHRAVHMNGNPGGRTLLVHGAAGAVGNCAVVLAHRAGARVIATVRTDVDRAIAADAGADVALLSSANLADAIRRTAPNGVDHIIDVAFGANATLNADVLAPGGSIAAYASDLPNPTIPFWPLLFRNAAIFLLGSDDFPVDAKLAAVRELNAVLESRWTGPRIAQRFALADVARAHDTVDRGRPRGCVIVTISSA